jgi:hypothetical protein
MKIHLLAFAAFAALAACKGGYDKDWSTHKLVATDDTVGGVAYRIEIPEGLPKIDTSYAHGWDDVKPEGDAIPKVGTSISILPPKTLEEALDSGYDRSKANFVRTDVRPDGFALTDVATDKHRVAVRLWKKIGAKAPDKYLECHASQQTEGGELPSFETTRKMLERICDSMTPM